MKNFRRKLKNILNPKGVEKSGRITDSDSSNMMEKKRQNYSPHHRSLPPVPGATWKQTTFPPTYRDAKDWLAQTQPTIDRALEIIERYPGLINQKSCERLSEVGVKIALKGTNSGINTATQKNNDSAESKRDRPQTNTEDSNVSVPEILVSQAEDEELLLLENQPKRLFVCGHIDNDVWHRLLVDLCKHYSIRCMSPSDYPECNRWLSETDVFLFLMDDTSVKEYPYQDQLRMAVVLDLNIVYVRDLGFELKITHNSGNCYFEKTPTTQAQSQNRALLHPNIPIERMKCLPLDSISFDNETNEGTLSPHDLHGTLSPPPTRRLKSTIEQTFRGHHVPPGPEIDVIKITEKEYGTALVYHHLYHNRCLDRIICAISSQRLHVNGGMTYITTSRHSLLTPVSNYSAHSGYSSDSAVGDMYHSLTPEPFDLEIGHEMSYENQQSIDEIPVQTDLKSPTETIYLVSPAVGDDKLKVFHWPEDVEKETIANSPSVDSFGFQDIDLSKSVNEIDLFEANLSD